MSRAGGEDLAFLWKCAESQSGRMGKEEMRIGQMGAVCGSREDGRIGVLFAALVGIVLALVLVFANIAAVHLQHRRGMACADALALAGASVVDDGTYFCAGCANGRAEVHAAGAQEVIQSTLVKFSSSTCKVGTSVQLEEVQVSGADVQVTVGVMSELPFLPPVIGELGAPYIVVSGSAHIADRP